MIQSGLAHGFMSERDKYVFQCVKCGTRRGEKEDGGITVNGDGKWYGKCVTCDDEFAVFNAILLL